MQQLAYHQWALLPVDPDPTQGEVRLLRPPMLTVLALDPGASLVFCFRRAVGKAEVDVELTALTALGRSGALLETYTSDDGLSFRPILCSAWQTTEDGAYVHFTSRLEEVSSFAKLALRRPPTAVVSRVTFRTPA